MNEYLPMPPEDRIALEAQLEASTQLVWDLRDQLALAELSRAALMNVLKGGV